MASSWGGGYGPTAPAQSPAELMQRSGSGDRPKKPQSRQLLSCTKCRERKVKCDRTKPCSGCCARGHPKECEFVVGEGNDYSPIQQSYEIRKLRAENQRLKERLQAAKLPHSGDDDDGDDGIESKGSRTTARANLAKQRRFGPKDRTDNLYFGTPGLASIVHDFANMQLGTHSLTHTMPKAQDMYASRDDAGGTMYPFQVLHPDWTGTGGATALVELLRNRDDLFSILDSFQLRAQSCSFPHTPEEKTRKEIERFLADPVTNAQNHPDMLALIFATLATGLQMGQYDKSGGKWIAGAMAKTTTEADVYLAASMQALRIASFMSQPTLLCIQTLVMLGPYLTNSGRFLDAWTLFGTTVRMAHSIGLHRDPKILDPSPPLRESMIRRTLWWWMLHMDQQYSVTLGRPLGISGIGDCPPPEPLTTNPTMVRLGEFVDHFTILARQILSSDGLMSVAKIDEFTDKLLGLWDTMPESLQFNESWAREQTVLPDWPLDVMSATLYAKVQSFLILLNRQRVERTQSAAPGGSPPGSMMPPPRSQYEGGSSSTGVSYDAGDQLLHAAPVRGRPLVINSSVKLLQAFLFFWHRNPAVLICWTMGQQAFNACMILIIDAWEMKYDTDANPWFVNQAYGVFVELARNGVHKLADLAVQRISDGLLQLGQRKEERRRQATASRRASAQQQQPILQVDTALMDWSSDTVMGNTGMFLLEDPGLQAFASQSSFQPLGWHMAGSAHRSNPSNPPTPNVPSPTIPVSHVTAAPFPVMSPPLYSSAIPVTNSPYAVGLQPRMPNLIRRQTYPRQPQQPHALSHSSQATQYDQQQQQQQQQQSAFTPINTSSTVSASASAYYSPDPYQQAQPQAQRHQQQQQPSFSQPRGPRHSQQQQQQGTAGGGPRGVHKLDRVPGGGGRSHQRRK